MSDSLVERAAKHLRISPGVNFSTSLIAVVSDASSSDTFTIAVIFAVYSFNPLSSIGSPLPPPTTTTFAPFFNLGSEYNNFLTLILLFFLPIFLSETYNIFFCASIKEKIIPNIESVIKNIYAIKVILFKSKILVKDITQKISTAIDSI